MLPILRIIPVGGVFLAILLLVLALSAPDRSRAPLPPGVLPMRGAMIARGDHPEWRQFLMLAAIRRADELSRLRELPDTPLHVEVAPAAPAPPPVPKVARLPAGRDNAGPDAGDTTGSIVNQPAATIPIDIGETSAFELPVAPPEAEKPPVIRAPQRVKSGNESRLKGTPRAHRSKAQAKADAPASFDIFQTLFGAPQATPPAKTRAGKR
jgi:hypothetical protein